MGSLILRSLHLPKHGPRILQINSMGKPVVLDGKPPEPQVREPTCDQLNGLMQPSGPRGFVTWGVDWLADKKGIHFSLENRRDKTVVKVSGKRRTLKSLGPGKAGRDTRNTKAKPRFHLCASRSVAKKGSIRGLSKFKTIQETNRSRLGSPVLGKESCRGIAKEVLYPRPHIH